ncbi:MAG: alpha/beta fold hydrolase [Chloroflexota bacterium]
MTNRTITAAMSRTIDVPGATIAYDVRAGDIGGRPLMLIGSPMGAGGFATLASQFPERTVITYDPRGVERSRKDDDTSESTPEQHADDIHAVISAVGVGPVDLFASSGGAVNALALVAGHPEDVRTLVAHEPPLAALVNDRDAAFAATEDIRDTYRRSGMGPAMAKFIMLVSHKGDVPADFASLPVNPAMFGLPTEDDGSRNDPLVGQNIITCTHYEPDVEALRGAATRIIVAVGAESDGELAHRGGEAVASRLGVEPVVFPSGHGGFLGGEYGQTGEPDAFGAKLREVLAEGS